MLKYDVVTDLKDGVSLVSVDYLGKTWGGKPKYCWVGGGVDGGEQETWRGCSFEFDC